MYDNLTRTNLEFAHREAEKLIADLKKENTELKKELKDANEKVVHLACNQNKDLKNKLAKATDLLKRFIETSNPIYFEEDRQKVKAEAEQFLKCENIILEDAQAENSPFDADEVFNKEMKAYPEEKVKKEIEK